MRYIKRCEERVDGKLSFTPEEVADGKLTRFIECLRENDCEIHIWTDGYAWVVEYIDDLNSRDGINFQAIDAEEDCVVDGKFVDWEAMDADGNE